MSVYMYLKINALGDYKKKYDPFTFGAEKGGGRLLGGGRCVGILRYIYIFIYLFIVAVALI